MWNVNHNERLMFKHFLCTYDLQAFISSVQYSKWNPPAFRSIKRTGVETVWRYVLELGCIMQGRGLVKKVKKNCERCRYLRERAINIEMGPLSTHSLRIAPAFYSSWPLWTIQSILSSHQNNNNQNLAYCLLHLFDFLVRLTIQIFYQ